MRWPTVRKDSIEQIGEDDEFWRAFAEALGVAVTPLLFDGYVTGWNLAFSHTPPGRRGPIPRPPDIDDEFVESAARRYLARRQPMVEGVAEHTRQVIREEISRIRREGGTTQDLYDELEPLLGPERAEAVAVTELTAAMGSAAQEAYRAAGFGQWQWRTVHDDRVDTDCEARDGNVYSLDEPFYPLHPRCRCFASPYGVAA